jgi:hypothetical protein
VTLQENHAAPWDGTVLYPTPLTNSVALVRERTIPTKRLSLVGEVSANFRG